MALQVRITGLPTGNFHNGMQLALEAEVEDTETGQTPTGLQYRWEASDGSFIGATDGSSATYHADLASNTDQTLTITCEVTLPGNPTPTVSAPSLTAMDELGITGQLVNMLINVDINGVDLFDRTDDAAIVTGSDILLDTDMRLRRLRWNDSNLILNKASGGSAFRDWWDTNNRDAYSAFIIINNGTVVELPGTWIGSNIGGNFMRWEVPSTETAIINALDSIATGETMVFGIADTDSIGIPDETASADATVNVQENEPPVVSITAAAKINPGATTPISVSAQDPEGRTLTYELETSAGSLDSTTTPNANLTAPNTPGPITVTATVTDAEGHQGVASHVIVVNSPPTVSITAPTTLEIGQDGNISIDASDPNSDAVTVLIETSAGSIDNPTALNTVITAPDTPQTITITVTVTDSDGLQTVKTAQITIVPNQPPTLSITVPSVLEIGQTGILRADASDPTGENVTVLWDASDGVIGNPRALETTIVVNQPGTVTVTCTATDARGATTTKTATITVRHPNRAPTVTLNVPAKAEPGQTVNIEAVVDDLDGDATDGEWYAPTGNIANPQNKITTITLPMETGVVPVRYEAMDDMGATTTKTTYITVGDPKQHIYTPAYAIELEGVDITDRWVRRDGLNVGKSLAYPQLGTLLTSGLEFNLDNEDGDFDYNNPTNFFVQNGVPAHGRGAKVLVRLGISKSKLMPVFAGQIYEVQTSLTNTKARIKVADLSTKLRQNTAENFGETITRRITDFDGANAGYDAFDPIFYFPAWGLPIARGSVSVIVHAADGDVDINIVETVATTGMLDWKNAEIDYDRGLIRFEAPPPDGEATQITATWKVDYHYKRPDFLVRQLLKHNGIQDTLGISDDTAARFAIEQALVKHPDSEHFSSHGRPYPQENGVVRWMRFTATGTWQMVQDNRLVEYDEYQDTYTKIATLPEDTGLEGTDSAGFGTEITGEGLDFPFPTTLRPDRNTLFRGLGATENRIHLLRQQGQFYDFVPLLLDGTVDTDNIIDLFATTTDYEVMSIYDNHLYVAGRRLGHGVNVDLNVFNLVTGQRDTSKEFRVQLTSSVPGRSGFITSLDVKQNGMYFMGWASHGTGTFIRFLDHNGNRDTSEESGLSVPFTVTASDGSIARNDRNIFFIGDGNVTAYTAARVRDANADFALGIVGDVVGAEATNSRLYVLFVDGSDYFMRSYTLGGTINLGRYVPYQFDTVDNNEIFFLCTNNTRGNALAVSGLNRVKGFKYIKSTDTWSEALNETTGQPQISEAYKINGQTVYLASNRKNSQVVRHNSETLWFFRRVQATQSGIAYYNDADGSVTDVYSESHSGAEYYGLPYSMDFALDIRSDGIYVYTFVVRHELDASDNYDGGTLKVYRKRVEPSGSQTEIYSETFTSSSSEEDYPVSVSGVILAENRSKFYFVLDWHGEGERPGKAELCTIAKSGSGSRTVIKTYDNPLVAARSPVKRGSQYFYLEGGWVRPAKSDPADDLIPDDERHYPDQGGKLIEIKTDDTVTDHGVVWRSASKLDAPDPTSDIYDGWGLHNAIISNMTVDDRDNLHFIAGYGSPYNITENLPFSSNREPVPAFNNFNWIQWGQDLATKVASFPTRDIRVWDLIQQLAQLMRWEIGFGPTMRKVDAIQAQHASITDWGANASLFFRPRTILPAHLRNAIPATGTVSSIALNDMGLPAEIAEFPEPAAGDRYTIIINKEMFTYTGVTPDSRGRTLTGVQRAQNGSTAAAHAVDAAVYFVDYFASGEIGTTLVSIQNRSLDFANIRNDIKVRYGESIYPATDQASIDENGKITLEIQNAFLSRHDQVWAEQIGDAYLDELRDPKELLQSTLVFSPTLQPGQLTVVYQLDRVRIQFKLFRLLQSQHHTHPRWQTGVTAVEIIPDGVPPRWLTVPRQRLRFNQSLNLDLNGYLAGTEPIRIDAQGLPSGFSIANGVLSGMSNTEGEHTITLTATNNDGEDTTSFEMLIGEPRWPSIPAQDITESTYLVFDYTNYEPEGLTPITYELGGSAPSWASISGDFILGQPPNEASDQTYVIPIVATNAVGSSTVNIIVNVDDTI